jgi:hypothetical protein
MGEFHGLKDLVPRSVSLFDKIPLELKQLGFDLTDSAPEPLPKPLRIKWGDLLRRTPCCKSPCNGVLQRRQRIRPRRMLVNVRRREMSPAPPLRGGAQAEPAHFGSAPNAMGIFERASMRRPHLVKK